MVLCGRFREKLSGWSAHGKSGGLEDHRSLRSKDHNDSGEDWDGCLCCKTAFASDKELLKPLIQAAVQETLEAEMTETLRAEKGRAIAYGLILLWRSFETPALGRAAQSHPEGPRRLEGRARERARSGRPKDHMR